MSQFRTTENVPETISCSGPSDGEAQTELSSPAWKYVPESELPAEDCRLNDPKDPGDTMDEQLPGDDKTINKP